MASFFKKHISPIRAKFISTLSVSVLIMIIVFLLTSTVMKKALNRAEKQYVKSCSQVLEGYASAIQFYLENYHTSLSSIYNKELFKTGDNKAIQNWIIQNIPFIHKDFCTVFYVDTSTCIGYFSSGDIINLKGKSYLNDAQFHEENYYVSNIHFSQYADYPVFIIEEPYFDSENNLKGILCASIQVKELEKISKTIKIDEQSSVYVADRKGQFLIHPQERYIGKIFIPESNKYKGITSDKTAASGDSIVETENENGQIVDLFSKKIKNFRFKSHIIGNNLKK